jgi:5,10-methylenetetrahydromethanopterin reductase
MEGARVRIEFGVGMGRNERMDEVGEISRVAEDSGFSLITFVDEPLLARDVHVMCTVAALNTRRARIGQGVVDPLTYHPSAIANAAASLHELSGGRAFLGIGAGGSFGKLMKPLPHADLRDAALFVKKFMAGEEAEYRGARMRSEWIGRPVPLYLAAEGPLSLQLVGEIADGTIFMGGPPELVRWKLQQIEKGALRAGRDPSKIDIWVRSVVVVAASKEAARREAAGHLPGIALLDVYSRIADKYPELAAFYRKLESAQPGILGEMRRIIDAFDPRWFEHIDAPTARLATQRIVDYMNLSGTPDDISEGIEALARVGVRRIATDTYTIFDKKGMLREIGDRIMPRFRN